MCTAHSIHTLHTLCSKKSDAKIQSTITMPHLIRIKYPISGFNYHLSDVNVAISTKSTALFLSNSCFKNGTQKTEVYNMENTVAGDFFTFQQDNVPAHRAGDTVEF